MPAFDEPLSLPVRPDQARPPSLPLVASLTPVLGGILLWLVTGSLFALWFAALGPVIACGSLIDGARTRRRDRRVAERVYAAALADVEAAVIRRHDRERARLRSRHPDVARMAASRDDVWRPAVDRQSLLVVGSGARPSELALAGASSGEQRAAALRARAATVSDAPVTVSWRSGVAVQGDPLTAAAVLRGLVLQMCLMHSPGELQVVGETPLGWEWLDELPHRARSTWTADGGARVTVRTPDVRNDLAVEAVFAWDLPEAPIDPRCGALIEVPRLDAGTLVVSSARTAMRVEAVSAPQASAVARALHARARHVYGDADADGSVEWSDVRDAPGVGDPALLAVALGREGAAPVVVDLVRDGPHALVAGVTGSGKSELLTTWIVALAAAYSPRQVSFLLADFKGGMTFQALTHLPHVTGVITDLDAATAERAIASLRAELRRREAALAAHGARDVADSRVGLGRLVIVVDEFAALLGEHSELHRVFTDVAARGRALGMHLVLGTQRASGVVRDALLSNCSLRVALRLAEGSESRALVGDERAARIPGDGRGAGRGLVRRAGDAAAVPMRFAMTSPGDMAAVIAATDPGMRPPPVWLPPLPSHVTLDDLEVADLDDLEVGDVGGEKGARSDVVRLGLADDPDNQRRFIATMSPEDRGLVVIGGPGTGRSTAAALLAAQVPGAQAVPDDPESAWDRLQSAMADRPPMLVVDDADLLLSRLSPDHAAAVVEILESLVRGSGREGVRLVLTALRLSGPLARLAELVPRRAILRMSSRAEHLAAGGDPRGFAAGRAPGRATLDGIEVQLAFMDAARSAAVPDRVPGWRPDGVTALVTRRPAAVVRELRALWPAGARILPITDIPPGSPSSPLIDGADPLVLVGDGETWQSHWSLLQAVRARHPLIVDASCGAELRVIAGERDVPPYCTPGAGRAWLCADGAPPRRVLLVPGE